ncbi:MAG: metallophosphoesterase, partial [Verrucomicrobia bacterium]|nr:metallophosphoesterase [Verrucomicrobiota bacterium]
MKGTAVRSRALLLLVTLWMISQAVTAREVTITLLHTTDVHGHLQSTRDYEGNENVGGLLRCATLIQAIREQTPTALLVDCGDLWIGSLESFVTRGAVVRRAVAWLRYDAWVVGNHDFDWGLTAFQRLLESAPAPALAANICS